jgi:aminopeptidase S
MRMSRGKRVAALLLALAACTSSPRATPTTSPTTSASPSVSASATTTPPPAVFDVARSIGHTRHLAVDIGSREAGSQAYLRAAAYAEGVLKSYGYVISRQRLALPAGTSQGVKVPAGETLNIIAEPPGFDPAAPHMLVGAHLDTVVPTPGANDNGSGAGMLLELARLAHISPPRVPIVFVEFGGEERRRPGASGALYGSRHFVSAMGKARAAALKRVLVLDMVGNGRRVFVCSSGLTPKTLIHAALAAAARLKIPARERVAGGAFSDYRPFENAGFIVAWLWSGENSTFHTPRDKMSVVQEAEIRRVGLVAWETLRSVRL